VCTLVDSALAPGSHTVCREGINAERERVPSGIYLCTMKSGNSISTRKMVLME
jgi:hypothetical protein